MTSNSLSNGIGLLNTSATKMRNEDSEFSNLRTVSSFDPGEAETFAVDVSAQDLQNFSPSSLLIESLIEQICGLLEKNPTHQRKLYLDVCRKLNQMNLIGESYEKEEFQFMRSHYQKALYQLLATAKTTTPGNKALLPNMKQPVPLTSVKNAIDWSRYNTEFHELDYIARGGFGHVFKAQHKLDGEIYAIKKIFLRYHSVGDFLHNLREVKMLAKLNHPNIVSYKAAWLEASEERKKKIEIVDVSCCDSSSKSQQGKQTSDSLEVVFESSDKSKLESGNDTTVLISDSSESMSAITGFSAETSGKICKFNDENGSFRFKLEAQALQQSAVLFIQMQLCQKTLRQWLDVRNQEMWPVNEVDMRQIFIQVVRGVEYIHLQGIVHHDIKPSNIFVSHDLRLVQVGDFGLACSLLAHPQSSLSVVATHLPGGVGTKLYAAPEQLRGVCDAKSDVYSLGIILFELIQPFNTAMERSKVISQLRGNQIPTEVTADFSELASIISQTVVTSVKKRPTSAQLLSTLTEPPSQKNGKVVEEQMRTITELKKESLAKDEEIAALKRQLEDLSKRLGSESPPST